MLYASGSLFPCFCFILLRLFGIILFRRFYPACASTGGSAAAAKARAEFVLEARGAGVTTGAGVEGAAGTGAGADAGAGAGGVFAAVTAFAYAGLC